jgi:hypothetical protein
VQSPDRRHDAGEGSVLESEATHRQEGSVERDGEAGMLCMVSWDGEVTGQQVTHPCTKAAPEALLPQQRHPTALRHRYSLPF